MVFRCEAASIAKSTAFSSSISGINVKALKDVG